MNRNLAKRNQFMICTKNLPEKMMNSYKKDPIFRISSNSNSEFYYNS